MAGSYYHTTAGGTCDTSTAWTAWSSYPPTSGSTTTVAWSNWVQDATDTSITLGSNDIIYVWSDWNAAYKESKKERREREAREREAAAERMRLAAIQEEKNREERERAAALLAEHLSDAQRKQLAEKGEFEVESESGKRYAIARGYAGNVYSLDERRRKVARHCIHPVESVPDHDAMLAQLLWLKWNEAEFLKVANTTQLAA